MASVDLGQRVKSLRQERELTLKQLAARSGTSSSALSKIENNLISPTFDTVQKIASGLGVGIASLFAEAAVNLPRQEGVDEKGRRSQRRTGIRLAGSANGLGRTPWRLAAIPW
jgi:transcriptional regulator with XRE-family HTH domain